MFGFDMPSCTLSYSYGSGGFGARDYRQQNKGNKSGGGYGGSNFQGGGGGSFQNYGAPSFQGYGNYGGNYSQPSSDWWGN